MSRCIFASSLALSLLSPFALLAQADGPPGIAFVQAPEQASGMAMAQTPQQGFAAAIQQCVDGGAYPEDCIPTNWCQPAGWSIDLFVMHNAGNHWHEVVCGLPNREVAQSVSAALCNAQDRPWIIECDLVQVYDPDGQPQL